MVLDANGRVVMDKTVKVDDNGLLHRIDLTKEEAGVYFDPTGRKRENHQGSQTITTGSKNYKAFRVKSFFMP